MRTTAQAGLPHLHTTIRSWTSTEALRRLTPEVDLALAKWSVDSASLMGVTLLPGESFVLTRELLIYPPDSFLAVGLLGLCGTARYPRKKSPFLDGCLVLGQSMDPQTLSAVNRALPYYPYRAKVRQECVRLRDYVRYLFKQRGRVTKTGKKALEHCVGRGRLADPFLYIPQAKERA